MAKVFQVDTGGTLTNGLVAYYKLEDTTDFWGSYNLINNNGATFTTGKISNGVSVNGSNQYLSNATNLGITGGAISIAGWVKIAAQPANNVIYSAFDQFDNSTQVGYEFWYYNSSGVYKIKADRQRNTLGNDGTGVSMTLTIGTWYFVVITHDGTNLKLYLDGILKQTDAVSGNGTGSASSGIRIGDYIPSDGHYWNGMVDEVGFWNRALTTTEVADLYNNGNGQTMIEQGVNTRRRLLLSM